MLVDIQNKPQYPKGEYRDILRTPQGNIIWETPWRSNLIVNGLRRLLATLVKGDPAGGPLTHWAVGTGEESWDTGVTPSEDLRRNFTELVNETGRKAIEADDIIFVLGARNQIEINVQVTTNDISEGDGNRRLREFGLFAGETMINHRIHARIDLEDDFPLDRTLRLTF